VLREGQFAIVPNLYVPDVVQDFESILSVPMVAYRKCFGVLNFHSRKRNAFRRLDFLQATFFGFVVAQVLHEYDSGCHGVRD
jgi:hypothetical protein